ncbi:hypothetical protein G4O51_12800 [Candidatus Bathyarchaeota archaeon A05DMB-2]|jgi:hypothetical protein|nr:hypothetical protein [Candidatus Bathyarchaeota archaeon A05DMB-2]MDH7564783.1 hypothetical protein [Candidatus Bathyarchaeota archaeon]
MQDVKETVKCCGTVYSIEAWRLVYGYIADHKAPDARFERQMKGLGVSRSEAYTLYFTQLYKPWEVSFSKLKNAKSGLQISVNINEKMLVPKARKR